jgi:hypothetical protein
MSIHTTCNEERRNEYKRINSKKKMGLSFIILRSHQDDHGESHKAGPGWIYQSSSTYNVFHFSRSCVVTPYALPAGGVHLELEMIGLGATPASDPGGGGPRLAAEREPRAKRTASDRVTRCAATCPDFSKGTPDRCSINPPACHGVLDDPSSPPPGVLIAPFRTPSGP